MSTFLTVTKKELQDHFNSWRFVIILLIIIASIGYVFLSLGNVKSGATNAGDFIFLSLFTSIAFQSSSSLVPSSFLSLMLTMLPLTGIILGLDAINSERNNGTLSRLVSQPIYRDNIINAKFAAGMITISIMIVSIVFLISAMGMRLLGIAPSLEEIWRLVIFIIIGIIYGGFWLALGILFSTLFKQVAVSAILAIAVWLFFLLFYFPIILSFVGQNVADPQTFFNIARISPIFLFNESMLVTLDPIERSASQLFQIMTTDAGNYLLKTPLTLTQSLIAVWSQITISIVLTAVCFALAYIKFMFEEIRSL